MIENAQSVEAVSPDSVVMHLNRLEGSVGELNSLLADLVQCLSPVMYNRSWPGGPHVIEEVPDESCSLVKNVHATHEGVINALNVVTALTRELNL